MKGIEDEIRLILNSLKFSSSFDDLILFMKAKELAISHKLPYWEIEANLNIAWYYRKNRQYKIGNQFASLALRQAISEKQPRQKVRAIMTRAAMHAKMGHMNVATALYELAIKESEKIPDTELIAGGHYGKGTLCQLLGETEKAEHHFRIALDCDVPHSSYHARLLNNYGMMLAHKGDLDQARKYYLDAILFNEKNRDKTNLSYNFNNLAEVLDKMGDPKQALLLFEKSCSIKEEVDDHPGLCYSLVNMIRIHLSHADLDKASETLERLFRFSKKDLKYRRKALEFEIDIKLRRGLESEVRKSKILLEEVDHLIHTEKKKAAMEELTIDKDALRV